MPKLIDADALCSRLDYMMSESSDAVSLSAIVALAVVKGTLIPDIPDASEPLRARIEELERALDCLKDELKDWHTTYTQGGDGGIRSSTDCDGCSTCDAIDVAEALLKGGPDA